MPVPPIRFVAGVLLLAVMPGTLIVQAMAIGRAWDPAGRWVLRVALSLVTVPFLLNPIWHITHHGIVLLLPWVLLLAVGAALNGQSSCRSCSPVVPLFEQRATKVVAALLVMFLAVATIGPYWPTELLGFPTSASIHDFVKHHAVLDSLARRPLPLGNVFWADGTEEPVYYYHFFYILPATLHAWSGADFELCFGVASWLGAVSLTGLVYMLTKHLKRGDAPAALAASLVTVVGGLDLLPLLVSAMARGEGFLAPTHAGYAIVILDRWADHAYRIHNILNQMMWSPQNVHAVMTAVLAALLLGYYRRWRGWIVWGPVLGVGIIGSSPWVALAVIPALVLWSGHQLVLAQREGQGARSLLLGLITIAVAVVALSLPSVLGYAEMSARHGKGLTANWPGNDWSFPDRLVGPGVVANVLNWPLMAVLDHGARLLFLPLIGLAVWRRAWRHDGLRWMAIASVIAVSASVTWRSHFFYNDLGQKIMLIPMVFSAVLAGCILNCESGTPRWYNPLGWQLDRDRFARRRLGWSWFAGGIILLGLPMAFVEVPVNSLVRHVQARGIPRSEREALTYMRYELPAEAVVQADLHPARADLAQLIRRRIGVMVDQDDVLVFRPKDRKGYERAVADVSFALERCASAAETHRLLALHGVTHVYVGRYERRRWRHLEKFDDRAWFDLVFEGGRDRVYRLIHSRNIEPALSEPRAGDEFLPGTVVLDAADS